MHDLDRTQAEYAEELGETMDFAGEVSDFESADFEGDVFSAEDALQELLDEGESFDELDPESDGSGLGYEANDEYLQGASGDPESAFGAHGASFEADTFETDAFEADAFEDGQHENEELALATELLSAQSEEELDQFVGKLIRRAWRGVRRIAPGILKPVGGALRTLVRKALPMAGMAFGGPLGAGLASRLAPAAGRMLGLELGGLSTDDSELAVARRMVRLGTDIARRAATGSPGAPPATAVRNAVAGAARSHAPGLVKGVRGGRRGRGTWYRKGNRLVIVGA